MNVFLKYNQQYRDVPLLFSNSLWRSLTCTLVLTFFLIHVHGTDGFTWPPNHGTIRVKCLAQGYKKLTQICGTSRARTHAGQPFMYSESDALSTAPHFPLWGQWVNTWIMTPYPGVGSSHTGAKICVTLLVPLSKALTFVSKLSTRSHLIICPLIFSSIGPRMPFVLILPSLSLFPAPRSNWVIVLYQLLVPIFGMSYRWAFVVAVNCLGSRAVLSLIFFLPNFFPSPFLQRLAYFVKGAIQISLLLLLLPVIVHGSEVT